MTASRYLSSWMKPRLHLNVLSIFSSFLFLAFFASSTIASAQSPAYVQQCSNHAASTSVSCSLTGVGSGHALVIGVYTSSATISSVTSNHGTPTSVIKNYSLPTGGTIDAYLLANVTSSSITITATESSSGNPWLAVVEYSNVATAPLDASADGTTTGTVTVENSANLTTTAAGDMLWSLCYTPGTVATVGTAPITWTAVPTTTFNTFVEDGLAGSAGTYYGQCTVNDSDTAILTVALKPLHTTVATPTFSPAAGTYSSAQHVTISDATSGSTIYYTTNGNTPTTSSSVYSSAITVSATETLKAIGAKSGDTTSSVGSAVYTITSGNTAATPTFNPGGSTYTTVQTVTISDSTAGSMIYYTINGTTPTTASTIYTRPVPVAASETLKAIAAASGYTNSAVGSAAYTMNLPAGSCGAMSLGTGEDGSNGGAMNGFLPFPSTNAWNTNISSAALDPNSATLASVWAAAGGYGLHAVFGSSPSDGGIPYIVVDSGQTPSVSMIGSSPLSSNQTDSTLEPIPVTAPIEGGQADCSDSWPNIYQGDTHALIADRATCWLYETYTTSRCNGEYYVGGQVLWDMANGETRPYGWTSTDAAGLTVLAGLVRYDEAASGTIKHAFRFTMEPTAGDSNDGYFVSPAVHAASSSTVANLLPEGARLRLRASVDISSFSTINQTILTAMKNYGLILADNGGNFFVTGATDTRWNDSDLGNWHGSSTPITSADFDVIQMSPSYPGYDENTAPTGAAPTIDSFSASSSSVSAGSPVTFTYSLSGDSYDFIDMIGPVKAGSGSVTVNPTATQTYTLYSRNQYGGTASTPITITVPGSVVTPPTFDQPAGTYSAAPTVVISTSTYPFASIYYCTTSGCTPTTSSTEYTAPITISSSETVKAIAVVPGYSSASAVSSAAYTIN
ncbi:MAG: chitobiase/beta-hexosaminidase C-terminal domain-containing protein [Terracidiphilus sp.]